MLLALFALFTGACRLTGSFNPDRPEQAQSNHCQPCGPAGMPNALLPLLSLLSLSTCFPPRAFAELRATTKNLPNSLHYTGRVAIFGRQQLPADSEHPQQPAVCSTHPSPLLAPFLRCAAITLIFDPVKGCDILFL